MNHPGRKLKTELTIGIQKLLASLPQPGPLALINGTLEAIARRTETSGL
jgi:hypothetical protein